jgi:hypothetical protein
MKAHIKKIATACRHLKWFISGFLFMYLKIDTRRLMSMPAVIPLTSAIAAVMLGSVISSLLLGEEVASYVLIAYMANCCVAVYFWCDYRKKYHVVVRDFNEFCDLLDEQNTAAVPVVLLIDPKIKYRHEITDYLKPEVLRLANTYSSPLLTVVVESPDGESCAAICITTTEEELKEVEGKVRFSSSDTGMKSILEDLARGDREATEFEITYKDLEI